MWLRIWIVLLLLGGGLSTPLPSTGSLAFAQKGSEQANDKKDEDKKPKENPGNGGGNGGGKGNGNGGGNGNGNGGGNGNGNSGQGNSANPGNNGNNGSGNNGNPGQGNNSNPINPVRSYYGQITISASGQVLSGETRIQSNSPWLKLAAPGMWIEANGTWNGDTFVATEVKLHSPQIWSYYQGPAELVGAAQYDSVSAWLTTNKQSPFMALKTAPDSPGQVRLVAYFDGSKLRAVPANFPAPPAGLKVGWVELLGTVGKDGLVWNSAKAFP